MLKLLKCNVIKDHRAEQNRPVWPALDTLSGALSIVYDMFQDFY